MKATIKSTGKVVEVVSRFMPKKNTEPSRDWVCNLSDGTCIDEKELEYIDAPEGLDEAAYKYAFESRPSIYGQVDVIDAFKAGAEWQEEQQDQPITGNSLEQEWLRYIDKKKKENRGELPSLGEYGWLQIARHFAEWQKQQNFIEWNEDAELYFNNWIQHNDATQYECFEEGRKYAQMQKLVEWNEDDLNE